MSRLPACMIKAQAKPYKKADKPPNLYLLFLKGQRARSHTARNPPAYGVPPVFRFANPRHTSRLVRLLAAMMAAWLTGPSDSTSSVSTLRIGEITVPPEAARASVTPLTTPLPKKSRPLTACSPRQASYALSFCVKLRGFRRPQRLAWLTGLSSLQHLADRRNHSPRRNCRLFQ